jgi:hypothetical protein
MHFKVRAGIFPALAASNVQSCGRRYTCRLLNSQGSAASSDAFNVYDLMVIPALGPLQIRDPPRHHIPSNALLTHPILYLAACFSLSSVHLLDGSLCDCIWIITHKCNNQTFFNNSVSRSVSPFHSSHRPYLNKARRKEAYHELMSNVAFIDPTSSFILSEPKRLPCIPSHFNSAFSQSLVSKVSYSQVVEWRSFQMNGISGCFRHKP